MARPGSRQQVTVSSGDSGAVTAAAYLAATSANSGRPPAP